MISLLFVFGLVAPIGCGGDDAFSSNNQSEEDWRRPPDIDQLFGLWSMDAEGMDVSCFSNSHLSCRVAPMRFRLSRGGFCDDGSYKFEVSPVFGDVTIAAALTPIWEWPRCDRISYEHYTALFMQSGDVSWDPISGVMSIRLKSWEQDRLCENEPRTQFANIWWYGNPWGPIYAEGVVELKFAWNAVTRSFHFYEGDCELASRGDMLWYYAGRGEFYAGDLYQRY